MIASLGRSRNQGVKPTFYLGEATRTRGGPGLHDCFIYIVANDVGAMMVSSVFILATPTPTFVVGARRAPSCSDLWEVYTLGPSPIGHKCAIGRGVRGPLMHRSPEGS